MYDNCIPFYLLCQQTLTNESMKSGCLKNHLRAKHPNHVKSNLRYFKTLKKKFKNLTKITLLFTTQTTTLNNALKTSFKISLPITKNGKNHTIGKQLLKPVISVFFLKILQIDGEDVQAMPLSNGLVSTRINKMREGVEQQLVKKLKSQKFLLQIDGCTIRKSEMLLLAYVKCIEKEKFQELLFCQLLETTTHGVDICNKLSNYFDNHKFSKPNIVAIQHNGVIH